MKHITTIIGLFLLTFITAVPSYAQEKASGSSAQLVLLAEQSQADTRIQALQAYLQKYDSPLAQYAPIYVYYADKYNLPWTLLPAIAGVESTFGKQVPCINDYGWGVYGAQTYCFNTEEEAIKVISQALRVQYMDMWGDTDIYKLGRHYAASQAWPYHVSYFMQDMEKFKVAYDFQNLQLDL